MGARKSVVYHEGDRREALTMINVVLTNRDYLRQPYPAPCFHLHREIGCDIWVKDKSGTLGWRRTPDAL